MKHYQEALVWAGTIIAIALAGFDTGVATALISGISVVALNSLFRRSRRACGTCSEGRG